MTADEPISDPGPGSELELVLRPDGSAVFDIAEGTGWKYCPLTEAQAEAVRESKIIEVRGRIGHYEVKCGNVVGSVRFGAGDSRCEIRVKPKVTVGRLLYLLSHAKQRTSWVWQETEVPAHEDEELLPAVADVFARMAGRALSRGMLRGYRPIDATSPVMRGRLRESDQIRRQFGMAVPLEIRYSQHTVDITENQLLLAATRRLLALSGLDVPTVRMLHHIAATLADVSPLPVPVPPKPPPVSGRVSTVAAASALLPLPLPRASIPEWQPTRVNAHYHSALRLAETVLREASFERDDGTVLRVDGLLVNMEKVFEDFVSQAVGSALVRRGGHRGRFTLQDNTHHLDEDEVRTLIPDLVYYQSDSPGDPMRPAGVLDAKYIRAEAKDGNAARDALYQVLTYCTVLGLSAGHIVYAGHSKDGPLERRSTLRIRGSGVRLWTHVLDLSTPIADLRRQIEQIAVCM